MCCVNKETSGWLDIDSFHQRDLPCLPFLAKLHPLRSEINSFLSQSLPILRALSSTLFPPLCLTSNNKSYQNNSRKDGASNRRNKWGGREADRFIEHLLFLELG